MLNKHLALFLLCLSGGASAACTTRYQRKPWQSLTADEKNAYLQADLCLMKKAPKGGIVAAAQNIWDELQYIHVRNTAFIHDSGQFLPWHRYYVTLHERLIRQECNYTGPMAYWAEPIDAVGTLEASQVFAPTAFGGNGKGALAGDTSNSGTFGNVTLARCVIDGAFANTTLHVDRNGQRNDYCLSRSFNDVFFQGSQQAVIDLCLIAPNYTTFWNCIEQIPHRSGHGGTGGTMIDVRLSPGDPVFFLHHTWLDSLWWKWQSALLGTRLYAIGGNNVPPLQGGPDQLGPAGPEFTEYDGDPGNTVTLNHTLWMLGMIPNTTAGAVMDIRGDTVCAEYVY